MRVFYTAGVASLFGLLPYAALAQTTVPGIQANASASASASAGNSTPTMAGTANQPATPPPGWPPATVTIKPPVVPLGGKGETAANLSARWRDRNDKPVLDANGVLRWVYGNSQIRVICAPLDISDIELQPGETVNNVRLGDVGFWSTTLAISGSSEGRVTHVTVKPREAGRETSMTIYTDRRTYSIKLISTPSRYTAMTGFTYPEADDSLENSLASYRTAIGAGAMKKGGPTMTMTTGSETGDIAHIEMLVISGDNPSWKPLAAYTDGRKTYIQFPHEMQFGDSPTLLGMNADDGLFSSPTERRVIYRWLGDRLIADTVMDHLKLVLGVGGSQTSVYLTRRGK